MNPFMGFEAKIHKSHVNIALGQTLIPENKPAGSLDSQSDTKRGTPKKGMNRRKGFPK
jgi:hypothetical protein